MGLRVRRLARSPHPARGSRRDTARRVRDERGGTERGTKSAVPLLDTAKRRRSQEGHAWWMGGRGGQIQHAAPPGHRPDRPLAEPPRPARGRGGSRLHSPSPSRGRGGALSGPPSLTPPVQEGDCSAAAPPVCAADGRGGPLARHSSPIARRFTFPGASARAARWTRPPALSPCRKRPTPPPRPPATEPPRPTPQSLRRAGRWRPRRCPGRRRPAKRRRPRSRPRTARAGRRPSRSTRRSRSRSRPARCPRAPRSTTRRTTSTGS